MNRYYFFGAGNNCHGAICFWGTEHVIAIVDNSSVKIGTALMGIPIISFEEFKREWNGEQIVITAYEYSEEIIQQLESEDFYNYYVCPFMQSGFYNCDEIIERLNLTSYKKIDIYDINPISEKLFYELSKRGKFEINYVSEEHLNENDGNCKALIIVKNNLHVDLSNLIKKYQKVLCLFEEISKMRRNDFKYLKKYKDIYNGENCFLIGNGPSLCEKDLDKIYEYNIKSFGCNGIYRIFEKTKWRPDYYVIGDSLVWEREREKLPIECTYFMRKWQNWQLANDLKIQFFYAICEKYYPQYPTFSDDITKGVYVGRTVMYNMLQIAVYMGFKNIYLLGVDFSFGEDGKGTHFCKDYINDELIKENIHNKEKVRHAYIAAKKYADSNGIKIFNATRGGYLEVFERVDIDQLFEVKMHEHIS